MSTRTTSPGSVRVPAVDRVVRAALDFGAAADTLTGEAARMLGVNRTDMRLVALLQRHRRLRTGQLATLAGLSPAATTTAVRRLVAAGYVVQAGDPTDGRRVMVTLTDLAHAVLAELYAPMIEQGRHHLDAVDPDELGQLEHFLRFVEMLLLDRSRELATRAPLAGG